MRDYTGKTIFVGIDVHKKSYSLSVVCDKALIKRDKIEADPQKLYEYLSKFKNATIKSAYEAGFCGFYLHRYLIERGIDNIIVNPASIEISARDVVKTDKRDSLKIATQLADGRLSCIHIPSEKREDKRHLTRLREQFVKQKNRTGNQIKSLLHLHGLIEAKLSPKICEKWLFSIDTNLMQKNCLFRFVKLCKTWLFFNSEIKQIDKEIAKEMESDDQLECIWRSFPGIGPTTASKLINELGDMSQFSNEKKLFSFAGLTPREHSSGESVRLGHISRQGKPIIRKLLVEASWIAIRKDPSLNEIFSRIAQKAGKKRAIVAIARIMLGRIRTCIKENRLYVTCTESKAVNS